IDKNACVNHERCGECISTNGECFWCSDPSFESFRCNTFKKLQQDKCVNIFPKEESHLNDIRIVSDKELSEANVRDEKDIVQLKPQRIALKLRPNTNKTFKLTVRQAVGYPVDLYYLMDLTFTMKDHKYQLAKLGDKLAKEMRKITGNFKMGFGSFVDKPVAPFTDITPGNLERACGNCLPTYGFRNHLSLSDDAMQFVEEIKRSKFSGNIDSPEGGLDAIMQAIVCKEKIGWRNQSRKLLVYATDDTFHHAGDGKLAGILTPNDEKCHIDDKNYYSESSKQDYPSISQINVQAQQNNVNIIFAVARRTENLYRRLSKFIEGSDLALLSQDSNVVQLIRNSYDKITSTLTLKDNLTDDSVVRLTYHSGCREGVIRKTDRCENIRVGDTIDFDITLEVISCPKNLANANQTVKIKPLSMSDELLIDLKIVCECDCEKLWKKQLKSPECNAGNGTFECGICSCNENYYGKKCECELNSDKKEIQDSCFHGNDTKVCSGNGVCSCGLCLCKEAKGESYYGKYCECDRVSCKRHNGKVCGGEDNGICDCGRCVCKNKWTGDACECPLSQDTCMDPFTNILCSGHGKCECGKCICDQNDRGDLFTGKWCEDCPTCSGHCDKYMDIVKQQIDRGYLDKSNITASFVDRVKTNKEEKLCEFFDNKGCKYLFKYKYEYLISMTKDNVRKTVLTMQKAKQCPEPINVAKTSISIVGSILFIGIITLFLWKMITYFHDKREFEKFEKEIQNAKWGANQNPIFKPSTAKFENPTFKPSLDE
ncbi:Integrin beta-PS-like protein, partial [Dinothrombium tinctorium]